MDIAVCIKQVPVSNDVSVDPVTHALVRGSSEGMVNPTDLNALEEAIILKEKTNGKVVVFTMGPLSAEKSLITALAMGCDEGCLITDRGFAGGDTIATSKVLVEAIKHFGDFDLILTGALTADGATGQVGPMIAEFMSIPHVSEVQSISYEAEMGGRIEVTKKLQNSRARIAAPLPSLLTVSFGCNTPRLPTLRTQRAAKSKPMTTYTNEELKMLPGEIGLAGSPTAAVDSFEPENVSKATFLSGSAEQKARMILDLIEKEKGNN